MLLYKFTSKDIFWTHKCKSIEHKTRKYTNINIELVVYNNLFTKLK